MKETEWEEREDDLLGRISQLLEENDTLRDMNNELSQTIIQLQSTIKGMGVRKDDNI